MFSAAAGLLMPFRATTPRMAVVNEFDISRVIKEVTVFDGDYAGEIVEAITEVASYSIAEKGSFTLAIPGGSVVAAAGKLEPDAFDMTKMHIFLVNEKIPSYPGIEGALGLAEKLGVPKEQVHGIATEGTPTEVAAAYSELLSSHPEIDNSGRVPSFDMMLLGTGGDGHVGCLFPGSAEIKATGQGKVVIAGNNDNADGDFVACTMDVMCATKVVLVSAAGGSRAPMVAQALGGAYEEYECPAALVEALESTMWFVDTESVAQFEAENEEEDDEATDAD